ncbi:hypothetical protein P22_3715 [Propionispora sp. 2/2-37]|uniref:YhcH/YjgK/YiaL family protein n=1 Tax=Propionispora sp. 2/2-37 TaxID=1677858 RepID=UPI0006BB86CC|nr:YhcH/YjgK/YiaL family protein [Propionispora sp. 2/2-37]CUH97584.1 hypothetical protein P22_3715 [Propionispora sp. 2/2-37]
MLTGTLSNLTQEVTLYPAALQKGFTFLLTNDLESLPLGKTQIEGDDIFAIISEYRTESYEARRPEAHAEYLDIQYVCRGTEMIVSSPLSAAGPVIENCLQERDVIFFKHTETELKLVLHAGMFAVYFPWDVHRPNCSPGDQPETVRKIVVKIAMRLLSAPA